MKNATYHLLIRTDPDRPGRADVWLVRRDGDTLSGVMHGETTTVSAEHMAAALALPLPLPVVREEAPAAPKEAG